MFFVFFFTPISQFLKSSFWVRYGENETWKFSIVSLPSKRNAQVKIGFGAFQRVMKTKQSSPPIPINNKILTYMHTEL